MKHSNDRASSAASAQHWDPGFPLHVESDVNDLWMARISTIEPGDRGTTEYVAFGVDRTIDRIADRPSIDHAGNGSGCAAGHQDDDDQESAHEMHATSLPRPMSASMRQITQRQGRIALR